MYAAAAPSQQLHNSYKCVARACRELRKLCRWMRVDVCVWVREGTRAHCSRDSKVRMPDLICNANLSYNKQKPPQPKPVRSQQLQRQWRCSVNFRNSAWMEQYLQGTMSVCACVSCAFMWARFANIIATQLDLDFIRYLAQPRCAQLKQSSLSLSILLCTCVRAAHCTCRAEGIFKVQLGWYR